MPQLRPLWMPCCAIWACTAAPPPAGPAALQGPLPAAPAGLAADAPCRPAEGLRVVADWRPPCDLASVSPTDPKAAAEAQAWSSLLSAAWPQGPDGAPDPRRLPGQGGDPPAAFEAWMPAAQLFPDDGGPPADWGAAPDLPSACAQLDVPALPRRRVLRAVNKADGAPPMMLAAYPELGGRLFNAKRDGLHVETLMNEAATTAIRSQWPLAEGQTLSFPVGCADQAPPTFIQAAWLEVEAPLDPQDFHTAEVFLYDSRSRRCKAATVGLTSLLISARTQSAPQWTWASFERRDNAPGPDDNRKNGDGWLFFDGGTPSEDCALSPRGPACTWNQAPDSSGVHRSQPSQIVREQALPEVDPASDSAGAQAATLLREISATNPWNQLVLVGALWGCPVGAEVDGCSPEASPLALPAPPNAATCPPAAVSAVLPDRLDNTVLLPYAQGGPSCWTCHSQPRVAEAPPRDHRLLFSRSP